MWEYNGEQQELRWDNLRTGSIPSALFITHRLYTEGGWFFQDRFRPTFKRSAYIEEIELRHNLSDRNIEFTGGDRSKTLLYTTKRNLPYRTIAPHHRQK